jgi:uncharacterized protein (DUF1499 family)
MLLAGGVSEARADRGMSTNIIKGLYRNYVRTTPNASNPSLRTRTYAADPDRIFKRAQDLVSKQSRWKVVETDGESHTLKIEAKTRFLRFVDDVTISIEPAEGGGSLLNMESRSRIGFGDFGTNARRVGGFLRKFDDEARANGEM